AVSVFCPTARPAGNAPLASLVEEGVHIYRVPIGPRNRRHIFQATFGQRTLGPALERIISIEAPDIIHINHLMGLPAGLVDQIRAQGIPYVVTLHDYWFGCANAQLITNFDSTLCSGPDRWFFNCGRCALARAGSPETRLLAPLVAPVMAYRNRLLKPILADAAQTIAPSVFVRQASAELGLPTTNMVVIRHGIEGPPEATVPTEDSNPRFPDGPLRVGYLGGLAWQKGVHVLVNAVNLLPDKPLTLAIYGSPAAFPDYVASLKKTTTNPAIRYLGPVGRRDLWNVLDQLDLLVVPSLWYEAAGLVILEAFAAGVPVVASRIGAIPESVTDGVDGLLVPAGDEAALRNVLLDLLADPLRLAQLREGIKFVPNLDQHCRKVEEVYRQALAIA
ncbi:MAG: glycosyltransferase, partial [Candidatus Promineifilaceae bacterium]